MVPKHMDLVLISFTIILLFEQNFKRPFSCFCRPEGVSENRIRSSPHRIWAMISFDMAMPTSDDRYVLRSDIYLRNINPLGIPPWLTPRLFWIGRLSLPLRLTWKWVFSIGAPKGVNDSASPSTAYQFVKEYCPIYHVKGFGEVYIAYIQALVNCELFLNRFPSRKTMLYLAVSQPNHSEQRDCPMSDFLLERQCYIYLVKQRHHSQMQVAGIQQLQIFFH